VPVVNDGLISADEMSRIASPYGIERPVCSLMKDLRCFRDAGASAAPFDAGRAMSALRRLRHWVMPLLRCCPAERTPAHVESADDQW